MPGSRLRQGYGGPRPHSAAEALAKAARPGMTSLRQGEDDTMFDITPTEWTAILLSLRVAVIATLVVTPFGIALAWLLARRDFWGKSVVDAIVHLPLVLPP